MNAAIEIHDSTLAAVTRAGGAVIVRLDPAYIHRSEGRPGIDAGEGWLQAVELLLAKGQVESAPSELPCSLIDGVIRLKLETSENMIPLPLRFDGSVRFEASSCQGESLVVSAEGLSVRVIGEGTYLEAFPGAES